jgi:hypothetical protein
LVKDSAEMLGAGAEALEELELGALADELLELEELLLPHAATTMLAHTASATSTDLLFSKLMDSPLSSSDTAGVTPESRLSSACRNID